MTTRKLPDRITVGETEFSAHFNSDLNEYSVKVLENGRRLYNEDRTYFASDNKDCVLTMRAMAEEERQNQLRSNNDELADVVGKCQTLQKLWDHNRMLQDTLLQLGRKLAESDITPFNRTYWTDKVLMAAKNISDHDEVCALLQKAGVNL